jgi:hypothetical protein
MTRISKPVVSFGALVLAAGVLMLSVPPAAHAIAVALAQVNNTVGNPAVTQDISKAASQLVTLGGGRVIFYSTQAVQLGQALPGLPESSTGYSVPLGSNLVITDLEVNVGVDPGSVPEILNVTIPGPAGNEGTSIPYGLSGSVSGGQMFLSVNSNNNAFVEQFDLNAGFQQIHLQSGIVAPAQSRILVNNNTLQPDAVIKVVVRGYLTSN